MDLAEKVTSLTFQSNINLRYITFAFIATTHRKKNKIHSFPIQPRQFVKSAVIRSTDLLAFFSLFSLRPDPDRHLAILKIGVNHATCYVYSPKAVETLLHGQCYEYVKYIFFSFY